MSYEGYTQNLCENGHLSHADSNWIFRGEKLCSHCTSQLVWTNAVDQTNCYEEGVISEEDWKQFLLTPEVTEVCNLGHTHITQEATYRIPTDEEAERVRVRIVDWDNTIPDDPKPIYEYLWKVREPGFKFPWNEDP